MPIFVSKYTYFRFTRIYRESYMSVYKYINYLVFSVVLLFVSYSCSKMDDSANEDVTELCKLNVDLSFDLGENLYDGERILAQNSVRTVSQEPQQGTVRYIARFYPVVGNKRSKTHSHEFVYTKNLSLGYDHNFMVELEPGDYELFVWSDLLEQESDCAAHNVSDFSEITVVDNGTDNNVYREAFRGNGNVSLSSFNENSDTQSLEIQMERPMARFEFITSGVPEFYSREINRRQRRSIDLNEYTVVFMYVGYVPDTYNIYSDKPVDSATGMSFRSSLAMLGETDASVGFDYVFVNNRASAVTVRIGVYDAAGTQVALTEPIDVPLMRGCCTVMYGNYLMKNSQGGIDVDTEFDGDHTVVFKY